MSKTISLPPDLLAKLNMQTSLLAAAPHSAALRPSPEMEIARLEKRVRELEERIRELERQR